MSVDVLDASDVATVLRCAVTTVEERARTGDLPGLKFGDGWIFPAAALATRLNELALEQAAQRRKPAPKSGVLHEIKKSTSKPKRTPPALPAST